MLIKAGYDEESRNSTETASAKSLPPSRCLLSCVDSFLNNSLAYKKKAVGKCGLIGYEQSMKIQLVSS